MTEKTVLIGIMTKDKNEIQQWIKRKTEQGCIVWHDENSDVAVIIGRIQEGDNYDGE